jgi:HAE1 family hydrophobic/amphiphilic exporter-1
MDFIKASIEKPVSVIVGVVLIALFGYIGLVSLPVQLSPSVTQPEITVETIWVGATPFEIERDIIEEQEDVLKGVRGLVEMESTSQDSLGSISLKFDIDTELDDALLRVSNKMNEVTEYPDNAERPVISASGASANPVIWMILRTEEGNEAHVDEYLTFFEDDIRQFIERVDGVSGLFIGGGTEKEMHVVVDPVKLASYGLTISEVAGILRGENVSVSAGNMELGRLEYRIRTVGEFRTPEDIENIILKSTGRERVRLSDVGFAKFGFERKTRAMLYNFEPGIAIGVRPEPGTNILNMTNEVERVVDDLNETILKENGIYLHWAYDQRGYINGAIDLVQQNIMIGAILAVIVLFTFLRSLTSTVVVALSIPISVIGTFIFLAAFGRNLNVVSLAGISFAVGMLVDNAIVVLENIDRHKGMGKSALDAAHDGAKEVWGAVLASTLTTVAVFLPIVFIQEEAGQLFKDIAIAVTCAVFLSLFVSVSVIPMLAGKLYKLTETAEANGKKKGSFFKAIGRIFGAPFRFLGKSIQAVGNVLNKAMMGLVHLAVWTFASRITCITILVAFSIGSIIAFLPKLEYLPQGNRNLLLNIMIPPPGLSYEDGRRNGWFVFDKTKELFWKEEHEGLPGIDRLFYIASPGFNLFGVISTQEQRVKELIPFLSGVVNSIPGVFGVSLQAGIFEQNIGEGRSIDVDISGTDLQQIANAGGALFGAINQALPGSQVRPIPSLELTFPEVRMLPDRDRLRAAGITSDELGLALDVLMDGRDIDDYKEEGKKKIDMVLKASEEDIATPEVLYNSQVAVPGGRVVPVSSLATLERTTGITQIRHLERRRTITLQVTPPGDMPLQEAMETIDQGVLPEIQKTGLLDGLLVRQAGAADKLSVTAEVLKDNFILAVLITYLLMSSLFGNFIYPLLILFTVPLAAAGGFIGLKLQNIFLSSQPMDILTMLGFVILIGVVVNNAILIVHQALNNIRENGMQHKEAVVESVRTRLRPIYMSASTSVFGMLPLAVAPGPGSELYRGLGSVVLGGIALSTIFTVFVIPSLLMFFIWMEKVPAKADKNESASPDSLPEAMHSP